MSDRVSSSYVVNGELHKVSLTKSDIQHLLQFSEDVSDNIRSYFSGCRSSRVCINDIYHLIYDLRYHLRESVYSEHE